MSESTSPAAPVSVMLSPDELELLRTAVRLLESTLGRDQADELRDVKGLLHKLQTEPLGDRRSPG